jgi:hypothetical protein
VFLQGTFLALCATLVIAAPAAAEDDAGTFAFAVLGDTPYFAWEALRLEQVIDQLNRDDLAFVLHVGDIKSGRDRCDDDLYAHRFHLLQRSQHALVLLAGDNDWTDCRRPSNGSFDPVERLEHWRRVFQRNELSLGQAPIKLERQSEDPAFPPFRENVRWRVGPVQFAAVHVVGSANNHSVQPGAEYPARNRANLAWLAQAFDLAADDGVAALVVAIHGDPRLEAPAGSAARAGFDDFVLQLEARSIALRKPVLLIHGDSHRFRWDQPRPSFRRLESFGSPGVGWVRVTVHPGAPECFSVEPNP